MQIFLIGLIAISFVGQIGLLTNSGLSVNYFIINTMTIKKDKEPFLSWSGSPNITFLYPYKF